MSSPLCPPGAPAAADVRPGAPWDGPATHSAAATLSAELALFAELVAHDGPLAQLRLPEALVAPLLPGLRGLRGEALELALEASFDAHAGALAPLGWVRALQATLAQFAALPYVPQEDAAAAATAARLTPSGHGTAPIEAAQAPALYVLFRVQTLEALARN